MTRIMRVFPRRTRATPADDMVRVNEPPGLFDGEIDEVHVSVTFSADMDRARWLARQWKTVAPVKIGGPATGQRSGDFVPGRYLKPGYVITSRGCPGKCWFCDVWKREGSIRELPIQEGYNVLDDNLLACSREHFEAVVSMLARQKRRPEFTGGLDARFLTSWHAEKLRSLKPETLFFAYDAPNSTHHSLIELKRAMGLLKHAGFTTAGHRVRCYVLVGYPGDDKILAEQRLRAVMDLEYFPMAMLYQNKRGEVAEGWRGFQRRWARPHIVGSQS